MTQARGLVLALHFPTCTQLHSLDMADFTSTVRNQLGSLGTLSAFTITVSDLFRIGLHRGAREPLDLHEVCAPAVEIQTPLGKRSL